MNDIKCNKCSEWEDTAVILSNENKKLVDILEDVWFRFAQTSDGNFDTMANRTLESVYKVLREYERIVRNSDVVVNKKEVKNDTHINKK